MADMNVYDDVERPLPGERDAGGIGARSGTPDPVEKSFLEIVKKDGAALAFIGKELQTPAVCSQAVKQNWTALQFVREDLHSDVLYKEALKQSGLALAFIPEEKQSPALCTAAVARDWSALGLVPEPLHTEALYTAAVEHDWRALRLIGPDKQTEPICAAAVKQNGAALELVKNAAFITQDMCAAAVKQNGDSLQFVPDTFLSDGLCMEAVKQRGGALRYVPKEKQSPELCLEAVAQNGYNLQHIIEQTPALCMAAVADKGDALKYAAQDLRSPAVCLQAVKNAPDALVYLFPEHSPPVNSAGNFEQNFKTLIAENKNLDSQAALQILNAAMDKQEQGKLLPFLAGRLNDAGKTVSGLLSQWERQARGLPEPALDQSLPAAEPGIFSLDQPLPAAEPDILSLDQPLPAAGHGQDSALEQFLSRLHTEEFYQHPDRKLKEQFYAAHLKAVKESGGPMPPVFNLTSDKNKEQVQVSDNPNSGVLNPFSPKDIGKMKAAAKVGVVFADESKKEEQLAFIKKNLPDVHAVIMQTLERQRKEPQRLVVGDTRDLKRGSKAPAYEGFGR
jgi:hypothetical protein